MGLLVALDVVAAAFLTIRTPFLKIGVSFLPVSLTGMIFGPVLGGIGAALSDVMQYCLFPQGAFIPGITLDAFLSGAVYGLILHGKRPSLWRCLAAAAVCELIIGAGLSTFWLYLAIPGKTFAALFVSRALKSLMMVPIETFGIYFLGRLSSRTKLFGI